MRHRSRIIDGQKDLLEKPLRCLHGCLRSRQKLHPLLLQHEPQQRPPPAAAAAEVAAAAAGLALVCRAACGTASCRGVLQDCDPHPLERSRLRDPHSPASVLLWRQRRLLHTALHIISLGGARPGRRRGRGREATAAQGETAAAGSREARHGAKAFEQHQLQLMCIPLPQRPETSAASCACVRHRKTYPSAGRVRHCLCNGKRGIGGDANPRSKWGA
mmetsp:Transcript_30505/g.97030  ORF Transcript_30505/g.97030 Transcript_30505/m.97030 type:complete len:217 (+) Transcript_30505:1332-1982(+)